MPLEAGTKLGPYEVAAPIGAGGMGEVYRARDTKLNRDVALKVLPEAFVNEPERLARFQREAEVLASLNHPNIAHIYGLEDSGETTALVLELVDGPTLSERIAHGAIPLEDALDIAGQIADALEAAHVLGIIHRDLKPANIKITPEGVVKVLDFGLAKAFTETEGTDASLSLSPTLKKGTAIGTILGTAAYMSPEQAKGKPVDTRTDVWAFGAVLYEMLSGERAFKGEDVSDTLVSVFRDEPDWTQLPEEIPSRVRQAMRFCLQKDAKNRVRDIAAVRLALGGAFETEGTPATVEGERSSRRVVPVVPVAVMLAVLLGLLVWSWTRAQTTAEGKVSRTTIVVPRTQTRTNTGRRGIAVSPAGTHVAYVANRQLYVRAIDALDAEPLTGTEGMAPTLPFFSPDGQWLGFFSTRDNRLMKIALSGGAAVNLATVRNPYGASWGSADDITIGQGSEGVFRVPANGGDAELLVAVGDGESFQGPQILPDGRSVLFTISGGDWRDAQVAVESLETGERQVLVEGGTDARYVDTGHLLYALAGNLLAVPFDARRLEIVGGPVPLVATVNHASATGGVNFDLSRDGMLVYLLDSSSTARTLVWVNRDGSEESIAAPPSHYRIPRISPDGTKAVLAVADEAEDLWIWEFARETMTRLTFSGSRDASPVWTPDGRSVVFASERDGNWEVYRKAVDGTGDAERLAELAGGQLPLSITPDGARLLYLEVTAERSFDFALLTLDEERVVEPLLDTEFMLDNVHLSPDGRWIAFESDASGVDEVYVRPFPDVDAGRWQISTDGGIFPLWGPDTGELFFWHPSGMMRVPVETEVGFRPGNPERILDALTYYAPRLDRPFDISPDGERFLMIKEGAGAADSDPFAGLMRIVVVQNWFSELERLVPTQ